jgi:hypothetical protein
MLFACRRHNAVARKSESSSAFAAPREFAATARKALRFSALRRLPEVLYSTSFATSIFSSRITTRRLRA